MGTVPRLVCHIFTTAPMKLKATEPCTALGNSRNRYPVPEEREAGSHYNCHFANDSPRSQEGTESEKHWNASCPCVQTQKRKLEARLNATCLQNFCRPWTLNAAVAGGLLGRLHPPGWGQACQCPHRGLSASWSVTWLLLFMDYPVYGILLNTESAPTFAFFPEIVTLFSSNTFWQHSCHDFTNSPLHPLRNATVAACFLPRPTVNEAELSGQSSPAAPWLWLCCALQERGLRTAPQRCCPATNTFRTHASRCCLPRSRGRWCVWAWAW